MAEKTDKDLSVEMRYIRRDLDKLIALVESLRDNYVTKEQHVKDLEALEAKLKPTQNLVYGTVAIILTSVVGGLMALIIIR